MDPVGKARSLRRNETWAERTVWRWLRDRRFTGYKFRRQQPIGPYVLDFFCAEAKLAIELDGGQHGLPSKKEHDEKRTEFLKESGIRVMRFWNGELRRQPEAVRTMIFNALQERAPRALASLNEKDKKGSRTQGFEKRQL